MFNINNTIEVTFTLFTLFSETSSKSEIVVTFSAILELAKHQLITTKQSEHFSDINLVKNFDNEVGIDFEYNEVS